MSTGVMHKRVETAENNVKRSNRAKQRSSSSKDTLKLRSQQPHAGHWDGIVKEITAQQGRQGL